MVPLPSQNTVAVSNQITLLILYYISSRLATFLKGTYGTVQVPNIFDITVSFNFINLCQTFLLFVPEMSASFTSYVV